MSEYKKVVVLTDLHGPVLKLQPLSGNENHFIKVPLSTIDVRNILKADEIKLRQKWFQIAFFKDRDIESDNMLEAPFSSGRNLIRDIKYWWDILGRYRVDRSATNALMSLGESGIEWRFQSGIPASWAKLLVGKLRREGLEWGKGILRVSRSQHSAISKLAYVDYHLRDNREVVVVDDDPYLAEVMTAIYPISFHLIHPKYKADMLQKTRLEGFLNNIEPLGRIIYDSDLTDIRRILLN